MTNTSYFFKHDLVLSDREHWALVNALSHMLMSFYDTDKMRGLDRKELQEFDTTKKLYNRISGFNAERLLKTYEEVQWNISSSQDINEECPF